MIKYKNLHFSVAKANSSKVGGQDIEIVILPNDISSNKAQKKDWKINLQKQWEEKYSELLGSEKKLSPKSFYEISLPLEQGGAYCSFFTPEKYGVYQMQTALRKKLSPLLTRNRTETIHITFKGIEDKQVLLWIEAISRLMVLHLWEHPVFGKKKAELEKKKIKLKKIEFLTALESKICEAQINKAIVLGDSMNLVRTLASQPSNELTPDSYVDILSQRKKSYGYTLDFLDFKKLKKLKAGAFTAVIQGSHNQRGGIAHLKYVPKSKKPKQKIALIGKGLCFDTGGHNLKTGNYMFSMHRDMTGSAVALALFETLIRQKTQYEVHAYLALAENMISPLAFRPNDVVVALDGTSIEVVDTDAEGRMVLADTLALARKDKPDLALDFATLTGSAVRAIGTHRCAVFSNRAELLKLAIDAGDESGERVWGFPLGDEFHEALKSDYADTLQCSQKAPGDHMYAATFLSRFISDDVPWVHCDLSAESNSGGLGLVATEVTGFGVAWGLKMLEKFDSQSDSI